MWLGYHFQGQKVKGELAGGGGISWRPIAQLFRIRYDRIVWLCGRVVQEPDQQVVRSNPGCRSAECNPGQVVYSLYTCASVTKQYNLVPANGRWRPVAGEVTSGLVESSSSNKSRIENILVLRYQDCPGKWMINKCGVSLLIYFARDQPRLCQVSHRSSEEELSGITDARFLYRPDVLSVTQPTASKHWRKKRKVNRKGNWKENSGWALSS